MERILLESSPLLIFFLYVMKMKLCITGCKSYIGSSLVEHLKSDYDVTCVTHKSQLVNYKCDVLIHIGWLCDNDSIKHFKTHVSNVSYSLRLLKHINANYAIFISSFGAKFRHMFTVNTGQLMYNISKRFVEILYKIKYDHCLIIRLPFVYDKFVLKQKSLAYRIIYENLVLDSPLPFVTRQTVTNFIKCCLQCKITGVVDLVDTYAKNKDELLHVKP